MKTSATCDYIYEKKVDGVQATGAVDLINSDKLAGFLLRGPDN